MQLEWSWSNCRENCSSRTKVTQLARPSSFIHKLQRKNTSEGTSWNWERSLGEQISFSLYWLPVSFLSKYHSVSSGVHLWGTQVQLLNLKNGFSNLIPCTFKKLMNQCKICNWLLLKQFGQSIPASNGISRRSKILIQKQSPPPC